MMATASRALETLMEGNKRFRSGKGSANHYTTEQLAHLAESQSPIAAVLTCIDSRVAPELIFDAPLGTMFTARTPGNVVADSVKWMIDIAVEDMAVPLFLVMAHTGCLAITQVVNGELTGPGGPLRLQINAALMRAKSNGAADLLRATIEENVYQTIDRLQNESHELRKAVLAHRTTVVGAVYDMHKGLVEVLPQR